MARYDHMTQEYIEEDDDGVDEDTDSDEHVCDVCGEEFDSQQALGGHKAAHEDSDE